MPTIWVPPGSKVTVRSGPSTGRLAAAAVAQSIVDTLDAHDERRADRARRRGNTFAVGDVVAHRSGPRVHAEVIYVSGPGLNEQIATRLPGETSGHAELAERYRRVTYGERRRCEYDCCAAWNALSFRERVRRVNELCA